MNYNFDYTKRERVTAKKMVKELRKFADALEGKVIRRKKPKKRIAPRVCHNCKFFVRFDRIGEEDKKYEDGLCDNKYRTKRVRELFESCSRYSPRPHVDLRADCLRILDALIRRYEQIKKMNIASGTQRMVHSKDLQKFKDIQFEIMNSHILTQQHIDLFRKCTELDFFKQCEIDELEKQWNWNQTESED